MKRWVSPLAAIAITISAAIPLYQSASISFLDAWLSLWLVFYVIGFALIALEGSFFMEQPEIQHARQYIGALIATSAMAAITAAIVGSKTLEFTLLEECRELFSQRTLWDWCQRALVASVLYTLSYVAIGMATWPFVRSYYEDPKHGLKLRVPSGAVVVALQMTRGLLTALTLVPLIASIPPSGTAWWLQLSLLLAAVMAVSPLLMASKWPAMLRLAHAIEISIFAVVYSFTVCWLLT